MIRNTVLFLLCCTCVLAETSDGIPINFSLSDDAYVTIVIDDLSGVRVRNLIQDTWFPKGNHTIYWDGYDVGVPINKDSNRYDIERRLVPKSDYVVRGLTHDEIYLRYEFTPYNPSKVPWMTADNTGGWLSDHQNAWDVVLLPEGSPYGSQPQLLIASHTAEAGHGLLWFDPEADKKIYGAKLDGWRGGVDVAINQHPSYSKKTAYTLFYNFGYIEVFELEDDFIKEFSYKVPNYFDSSDDLGLAVYGDKMVVSVSSLNELWFVEITGSVKSTVLSRHTVNDPRGLFVDSNGLLYLLEGTELVSYQVDWNSGLLSDRRVIISGLKDPKKVLIYDDEIYVSDWIDNRISVYSLEGSLVRYIGPEGGPQYGTYDETIMNLPNGFAIYNGEVWVAEAHHAPRRVSVYSLEGDFKRAYYGSSKYGGGAKLVRHDPSRLLYQHALRGHKTGIEFELDWDDGSDSVKAIITDNRSGHFAFESPCSSPDTVFLIGGREYYTTAWGESPWTSDTTACVWLRQGDLVYPVAVISSDSTKNKGWSEIRRPDLWALRPPGSNDRNTLYVWTDDDFDHYVDADEVQYKVFEKSPKSRVKLRSDLAFISTGGFFLPPPSFRNNGVPIYDISKSYLIDYGVTVGESDIQAVGDWIITFSGPIYGFLNESLVWTYHDQYPVREFSPTPPRYKGDLIETGTSLGEPVLANQEAGLLWAIQGDQGESYLFTADGLFVTAIGADRRVKPILALPDINRGDVFDADAYSFGWETFYPSINQVPNGSIYVVYGKVDLSIFEVLGLDTIRRLDLGTVTVSDQIDGLPETKIVPWNSQVQKNATGSVFSSKPVVDGVLSEWPADRFVSLSNNVGWKVSFGFYDGYLYVAYDTDDPTLLDNTAVNGYKYHFSTGKGLDIYFSSDINNVIAPKNPDENHIRFFISKNLFSNELLASRFVINDPAAPSSESVLYTSPVNELLVDSVKDVSDQVLVGSQGGVYEVAIPVSLLRGVSVGAGDKTLLDAGVHLGSSTDTSARWYWNNLFLTAVEDLPTEADYDPNFWGVVTFENVSSLNQVSDLPAGWSYVSLYVDPSVKEVSFLTNDLPLVLLKDDDGRLYYPAFNIDTILFWNLSQGYSIFLSSPASWSVFGSQVNTQISLSPGWNLIPFTLDVPLAVDDAFKQVSSLQLVVDDQGNVYYPSFGINTIGFLIPGKAYKIYVLNEEIFSYK